MCTPETLLASRPERMCDVFLVESHNTVAAGSDCTWRRICTDEVMQVYSMLGDAKNTRYSSSPLELQKKKKLCLKIFPELFRDL